MLKNKLKIILIGGTSHTGKSTLAKSLSIQLGAKYIATDSLARHPGRPWKEKPEVVPEHVQAHYALLSVDELISDVLQHYQRLWPKIHAIIKAHMKGSENLVLEGSALWPETVHTLNLPAVWLTASDDFLKHRIYISSNYSEKNSYEQKLIDQFMARTLRFDKMTMAEVNRWNLSYINVECFSDMEVLMDECLEIASRNP